jgi:LytR cell envelope-related transcriptional attenuator
MPEPREDTHRVARDQAERGSRDDSEPRDPRHRRERACRDRRRQWSIVAIAAVVGIVAGALGSTRGHTARALGWPTPTTVAKPPVPARTVLFAHLNAGHRVDLLAVVGVAVGGRAGSVVFVPASTLVEVPSFDTQALTDVPRLGGFALLRTAVANALGVRLNGMLVLDDAHLARLLAPADRLRVSFATSVQVDDAAGTLAFSAGQATLTAADATRVLIGPTTGSSLDHLVAVQAVLQGWFARLRTASVAGATQRVTGAAGTLVALAHANVNFDTLPVDTLSSGTVTRYEVQHPQAEQLLRADFPGGLYTTGRRLRVELLNGTGAIALTQAVALRVVPTGGEITLTGNVPGFGVRHTSVVYYRIADRAAARRLAAALGVGSVALGNVPLDVVDLTVVIGADFPPTPK